MTAHIHTQKKNLRKSIIAKLKTLTHEQSHEMSIRIAEHLTASSIWKRAGCIFCFLSMPGEVETEEIIKRALSEGKTVGVPRMYDDEITFHHIDSIEGPWEVHHFGIKEPSSTLPAIEPGFCGQKELLTITPGLAFDTAGGRLGRGGGFYDRFFTTYGDVLMTFGVCFSFQVVDEVPTAHHDCRIHGVFTEKGLLPSSCCPPEVLEEE